MDYADYLQWLHFAEGSAATRLLADMSRMRMSGESEITPNRFPGTDHVLVGTREVLAFIETYLAEHPYFGGQVFSAADIIMDMVVKFAGLLPGIKLADYPHFAAWQKTVEDRPAFKRMRAAALPDGKVPGMSNTAALLRGEKTSA